VWYFTDEDKCTRIRFSMEDRIQLKKYCSILEHHNDGEQPEVEVVDQWPERQRY
jgi:hypothetical protein